MDNYQSQTPEPAMGHVRWGALVGRGYPSGPPQTMGLGDLVLSDPTIHDFAAALQVVVVEGVVASLPSPLNICESG